jgi:hypothetical protein
LSTLGKLTAWIGKHLLALVIVAGLVYWFFTGSDPIMLARALAGNGKKLTRHHVDASGTVIESLDDLLAQASRVRGKPVSADAYRLASVSASEHWDAGPKEKSLIQRVVLNRVAQWGQSMDEAVTAGKGFGKQSAGRPVSTVNGPWTLDLELAESNLAGELDDDSRGACFFVHATGFRRMTDYEAICAKWKETHGVVPGDVGGVSSLRIFVPEQSEVTS